MRIVNKFKAWSFLTVSLLISMILIIGNSDAYALVPYITERVNLTPSGNQTASGNVQEAPTISQDGRYVAFATSSSDIVAGDTNNSPDVFVRDRKLGTTTRANLTSTGGELPWGFSSYEMSANGRFVIFTFDGSGVVPGDTNGKTDLFLRDLKNNTTEMVSLTSINGLLNDSTSFFDISADGRYVVFNSKASNVVSGDTNSSTDVFVRDRKLGTTALLSKSAASAFGNASSVYPSISCDGSYVTFASSATNLVTGDTNASQDIFLVDRIAGDLITNLTISGNNNSSLGGRADISCNGETIVFGSDASNLVLNDTNGARDIFAYSMVDGSFDRVNLDSTGNETVYTPNPNNGFQTLTTNSIDFSGRYVVFSGFTTSLVSGDTNNTQDIFLRDIRDGTTQIISKRSTATQTTSPSFFPSLSSDGREVVFTSGDTGFVSGDTNSTEDVFVSKTGI